MVEEGRVGTYLNNFVEGAYLGLRTCRKSQPPRNALSEGRLISFI